MGRGALGREHRAPARPAGARRRARIAAEGLGPRAGLQRAAGRWSSRRWTRSRASTTRTSKCWSSTTTPATRRSGGRSRRTAPSSAPRFRFFHVAPLAGFKAGALNFALRADRAGRRDRRRHRQRLHRRAAAGCATWCRLSPTRTSRSCRRRRTTATRGQSAFKAMCYAEYRGFFHIGMVTRNERNAIIQHGTMTLVRRARARQRWAAGPSGASPRTRSWACGSSRRATTRSTCPQSYGRGLMPDTFTDFKKQRFRWAYGAMQILKAHARRCCSWREPR